MTKIKICGLSRLCDISYVNEAQPDYCGFIINVPKSRRNISVPQLASLRSQLKDTILPVGVFVNEPLSQVAELLNQGLISLAQLHGDEDEAYLQALRQLTSAPIIKAFTLSSPEDAMKANASSADYILADSGAGSGRTFDWSLLKHLRRPYILAGGLTPANIPQAIQKLHPWAIDLSSGVESQGVKDREKIREAVAACRQE